MNRSIIVSLLKKNIDELILLTEGFSEMTHYPEAILHLAKNKTSDIRTYIDMLGEAEKVPVTPEIIIAETIPEEIVEVKAEEPAIMEEIIEEVITETEMIEETQEELPVEIIEEVVEVEIEEISLIELEKEEKKEEPDDDDDNAEIGVEEEDEDEDEDEAEDEVEAEDVDEPEKSELNEVQISEPALEEITVSIVENQAETVIEIQKVTTIGDKLTSNGISRNDLHARPEMNGIHASIANKKVDDIRQAISLGDRFRFQRELFKNNGEEMNKMLSYINQLATYNEVVSFLKLKYAWADDNETANDFYQLVKRKF